MNFRTLTADEIELRVGMANMKGFSLLLYKDARCDMQLLDEVVGTLGWKRHHEVVDGRLCCTVSVFDNEKKEWISKQDVGTESQTEKDKGQFSDAFKRACVNLGIGRELYSAPFIWINGHVEQDQKARSGYKAEQRFVSGLRVSDIEYSSKRTITKLVIVDEDGNTVYTFPRGKQKPQPPKESAPQKRSVDSPKKKSSAVKKAPKPEHPEEIVDDEQASLIKDLLAETNADVKIFLDYFNIADVEHLPYEHYNLAFAMLAKKKGA